MDELKAEKELTEVQKGTFNEIIDKGKISSNIDAAIKVAQENNDVILYCGSFYIMAEAREYLGFGDEQDP